MEEPRIQKLTIEDYWTLPDDGRRYEILEGLLEVSPSPDYRHQCISAKLLIALGRYTQEHATAGKVLSAPMDVILAPDIVCQPDLLYIRKDRLPDIVRDRIWGAPDLVIEILSPSTSKRDRVTKAQIYARYGVQEYWIVDPTARQIAKHILAGSSYGPAETGGAGEKLTSALFPGLVLRVDDIFAD